MNNNALQVNKKGLEYYINLWYVFFQVAILQFFF